MQAKPVCDPELEINRLLLCLESPVTADFLEQAGDPFLSQGYPFFTQDADAAPNIQRVVVAEDGQPPVRT